MTTYLTFQDTNPDHARTRPVSVLFSPELTSLLLAQIAEDPEFSPSTFLRQRTMLVMPTGPRFTIPSAYQARLVQHTARLPGEHLTLLSAAWRINFQPLTRLEIALNDPYGYAIKPFAAPRTHTRLYPVRTQRVALLIGYETDVAAALSAYPSDIQDDTQRFHEKLSEHPSVLAQVVERRALATLQSPEALRAEAISHAIAAVPTHLKRLPERPKAPQIPKLQVLSSLDDLEDMVNATPTAEWRAKALWYSTHTVTGEPGRSLYILIGQSPRWEIQQIYLLKTLNNLEDEPIEALAAPVDYNKRVFCPQHSPGLRKQLRRTAERWMERVIF